MKQIHCLLTAGVLLLAGCRGGMKEPDPVPDHDTFKISSTHVGEQRTINVWVPEGYQSGTDSLTVLYMPDGGVEEDFPHMANTLNDLIKAEQIRPVILVGVENTQRRRDLTGPTTVEKDRKIAPVVGGSVNFRSFIHEELFPEINVRYRTNGEKGIIGAALAGLFVTETFLLHPELFDFYMIFDPSIWWNDQHLIETAAVHLAKFPEQPKSFWFATSGAREISESVGQIADILEAAESRSIRWEYVHVKKEFHHTIFRATKEQALVWTFGNHQD